MPTVTIKYNLPEEQAEFDAAMQGAEAIAALEALDNWLRHLAKYENLLEVATQTVRDQISVQCEDRNVRLFEG